MATIVRYVGRGDVAQDVLQDTLVRALRGFSQFKWRGKGSLGGWLNRMAVNMSLNYLRDNRHMLQAVSLDERPEAGLVADEPTPADVEGLDLAELMRLVEELPTGYRTVFNLYCIEGYSHREIASELGISVNTSSSQLVRAKAMLARKINDYVARKEMHYEPGN